MKLELEDCYVIEGPLYRPFHKTLPRSCAFINWISVRYYETGCSKSCVQLFFDMKYDVRTGGGGGRGGQPLHQEEGGQVLLDRRPAFT